MGGKLERSGIRVAGFADAEMDFQLIRQLGATAYGGASVGECLALARRIENAVPASWVEHFAAAAARQEADAAARAARGHRVSARDRYLVASNSWRAAEYYAAVDDPAHVPHGLASRKAFLAAMAVQDEWDFEALELPFGDKSLPACYMRPRGATAPGPTLLLISGYDGTLEETFLVYGRAALERGYRVLFFTGPGQMDTLRFHPGICFVPEFERIGRVAVDYVLSRSDADPARIALKGISFGGYFATRIAVHEPRIRALIPNSPILDLHAYMSSFVGFDPAELPPEQDFRVEDIAGIPEAEATPQTRLMMRNLILRFGQETFGATYRRLRDFRVEEEELAALRCRALALVGSGEGAEPTAQYERFLAAVPGAEGYVFATEDGAEGHCQAANPAFGAAVWLDWLDEAFA